ncbi:MAG TPA: MXAN_6640 family putative metalloprotease [Candidatus Eisenbacteria bacterium]|nr:MXAN_6640 family putative metalloprotease [Candidatus Eisenbacteria bacterium]
MAATHSRFWSIACLGAGCLIAGTATADPPVQRTALERLDDAVARGEIAPAEAARERFFYLFDRRRMALTFSAAGEPPAKCGTRLLVELQSQRAILDPATRALLDAKLTGVQSPGTSDYTTAHFRIEFATSGPDAPVSTDVAPANGIPDFVEWTGAACEQAWATEVGQLGYTAPAIANGQNARYPVTYQAQESYGYTTVISGQQTRIVLHPSYAGFPFNDDPEGDVIGALRVTVAHELKHAIQRMYSPWTEDNWLELDATWVEDVVFDQVNDYVHFVRGAGSPFSDPALPLFQGNLASYEDCNWETYLAATLGPDHLRAFWERRRDFAGESVLLSWQQNLAAAGTDLAGVWRDYVAWNFASGEHAVPGYGYEEAAEYPTTPATFIHETLPVASVSWPVNGTAASTHLISNAGATLGGTPEFTFSGAPGNSWQVTLLLRLRAGSLTTIPVVPVSGMATVQVSGLDWGEIEWAAMVVGNPTPANPAISYSFSARAIAPILMTHARLTNRREGPPSPVVRAVISPGTSSLDPASPRLVYRVEGGSIVTVPMSPTGSPQEYAAELPATVPGTRTEYRIEARAVSGAMASSPSILSSFHSFETVNVFHAFEVDGGWTVGAAGDQAVSGVWERVTPRGTPAAPYVDTTPTPGAACFVTQNGPPGGAVGAADVDGGSTTLLSPVHTFYPGGGYARVEARYRRWYSNDIGARPDDLWRVDASNDGGATWVNVETVALGESRWVPVTVDLLARLGDPDRVRLRFVAEDAGEPSLVEAALDDFEILALLQNPVGVPAPEPAPGLALGPAVPNPSHGEVRLRLTLPEDAPVSFVVRDLQGRVVRTLASGRRAAGDSWIVWDGRTASGAETAAGIYWIDAHVHDRHVRRKIVRSSR